MSFSDQYPEIPPASAKFQNVQTILQAASDWGDTAPYEFELLQQYAIHEIVHPGFPLIAQLLLPYPTYSTAANGSSVGVVVLKGEGNGEVFEVVCPGPWLEAKGEYLTPILNGVEGPLILPVEMGERRIRIFFWFTNRQHIWFRELNEEQPLPANLGTGVELYNELLDGFRSIISSDGSVLLTENAGEIDVRSAFVKTGANDGTGLIRGATQANFELQTNVPALWVGTNTNSAVICSEPVSNTKTTRCFVAGSTNGFFLDTVGTPHQFTNCGAVATWNSYSEARNFPVSRSFIAGANGSRFDSVTGAVDISAVLACNGGRVEGGAMSLVAASDNASVTTLTANKCNVVLGGEASFINAGDHSTIIGGNATTNQSNTFTLNCGSSALNNTTANSILARAPGGTTIYSSNGGAAGVVLAANSSSWAAVCDADRKENLVAVDGDVVLTKLAQLPIYTYNYIGVPTSYQCVGPCAQDWHPLFPMGADKNPLTIETNDLVGFLLAGTKALGARVAALEAAVAQLQAPPP